MGAALRIIGVIDTQHGRYLHPFSLMAVQVVANAPVKFGLAGLLEELFVPVNFIEETVEAGGMSGSKQGAVKPDDILTTIIDNEADQQSRQLALSWFGFE